MIDLPFLPFAGLNDWHQADYYHLSLLLLLTGINPDPSDLRQTGDVRRAARSY